MSGQTREMTTVYDCGDIVEIDAAPARKKPSSRRQAKWKKTSEAQAWVNAMRRSRYVRRMLQLNFSFGAILYTLTYDQDHLPETMADAKKDFKNFRDCMKRLYRREGLDAPKIMAVYGRGEESGRIHIHVVQSGGVKKGDILGLWRKSHGVWADDMEAGEWGFEDIAEYLLYNAGGREAYEHDYYVSRNIEKPAAEPDDSRMKRDFDRVFTKKFCEDLQSGSLTREELNAKFPGFKVLEPRPQDVKYNPYSRAYVVHLRLLRVGARLPDWATTRKERTWMDTYADEFLRAMEEKQKMPGESDVQRNERLYGAIRNIFKNGKGEVNGRI